MSATEATARAPTPKLLLLVEDEADARTILARRLSAFGWNCLAHPSVESALRDPQVVKEASKYGDPVELLESFVE